MTDKPGKTGKSVSTNAHAKPVKHTKTAHLMQPFLDEYEKTENQTLAAKSVGVNPDTVLQWKKDPAFMKRFTEAHLRAQKKNNDNLKASALQRAINGNAHVLIRNGQIVRDEHGQPVVAYRDFETQLTMFMLKNRMPDEFKDKFEHEISGQVIMTLTSEFSSILKKHVPAQFMPAIEKELETLSAKLAAT